jgi:hypothetical protein
MKVDVSDMPLDKGDLIDNSTVSQLTGVSQRSPNFPFAKMAVAKAVEIRLRRERRVMTLKIAADGVRILNDPAAVQHNKRLNRSARRKIEKAARQMVAVDVNNLDPVEKQDHASSLQEMLNDRRALRDARSLYELLEPSGPGGPLRPHEGVSDD